MDNPILFIMALTPGIIGIATSKLLDGDTSPEPIDKGIMKYFLYSASALLLTESIGSVIQPIQPIQPLQKALMKNPAFTIDDFVYPALMAVIVALSWKIFLKKLVIFITNLILSLFRKNMIDLPPSALDKLLADGNGHAVEIYFPDGRIVIGVVSEYYSTPNTITIQKLPSSINLGSIEESEKNILVFLETGVIIKNYTFPVEKNDLFSRFIRSVSSIGFISTFISWLRRNKNAT